MVKKLSNEILISIAVVLLCGSVLIFSALRGGGSAAAIASELQQPSTNSQLIAQNNISSEESMDLRNATTTKSALK